MLINVLPCLVGHSYAVMKLVVPTNKMKLVISNKMFLVTSINERANIFANQSVCLSK